MESEVNGVIALARELKRPLATVRQLALEFEGARPEDARMQMEMVSVSERAMRQVDDLMKFEKLESGLFVMEPVAVRGICDEVMQETMKVFKYNRRELFVKYTNRAKLVMANRELLKSIIYNFLMSAVHFTGEGSRAELAIKDEKGKVKVVVRDFGPELPRDVWREMRQGFVGRPTSIAMRPGTSGLGLYIASKFSKYMNAEVGAVRHRDGTSFYVGLPVSKQLSLFEVY